MEQSAFSRFLSGGGRISRAQCPLHMISLLFLAACAGNNSSEFESNPDVDELALPLPIEGQCDTSCCSSCCPASPIIVDLAGDGLSLTSASDGVEFDVAPGDRPEAVSWTRPGSDDAWLVLDRNENALIDDGSELFGNFTDQKEPVAGAFANGYAALVLLDQNGDTVISAEDWIFSHLRLWRDANHNGRSEPDELELPTKYGIRGFGTDFRVLRRTDEYGNLFRYSARIYKEEGSPVGGRSYDVFLVTRDLETKARNLGASTPRDTLSFAKPQTSCSNASCMLATNACYITGSDIVEAYKISACKNGSWVSGNKGRRATVNALQQCTYYTANGTLGSSCGSASTQCCPDEGCSVPHDYN